MTSPTQRQLSTDDLALAVRTAFGSDITVRSARPLAGGTFGAVWRVELTDGRPVVLKAGPTPGARVLTYEAGALDAEAEYLRLVAAGAPEVPVPRVLYADGEWLFMSLLPGAPLPTLESTVDTAPAWFAAGAALAHVHRIVGPHYGYTGDRPRGDTWPVAFTAMVEAILDDAVAWDIPLPVPPAAVRAVVARHAGRLAAVTTPSLLHFDLWAGNVLATAGPGSAEFSGLIDGERFLYGDPLVDFVSPAMFHDIFADPAEPYVRGYRSVTAWPVDEPVRVRMDLYRLHLYLIMLVQFPSRGESRERRPDHWAMLCDLVRTLVARLARTTPSFLTDV